MFVHMSVYPILALSSKFQFLTLFTLTTLHANYQHPVCRERTYGSLLNLSVPFGHINLDQMRVAESGKQRGREKSLLNISEREIKKKNLWTAATASGLDGDGKVGDKGGGSEKIRSISEQEGELKEGEDGTEKEGEEEGEGERVGEESLSMSYCAAFSKDLKKCTCNVRRDDIRILPYIFNKPIVMGHVRARIQEGTVVDEGNASTIINLCSFSSSVTLITVTSREDFFAGSVDRLLMNWCGPKVGDFTYICRQKYLLLSCPTASSIISDNDDTSLVDRCYTYYTFLLDFNTFYLIFACISFFTFLLFFFFTFFLFYFFTFLLSYFLTFSLFTFSLIHFFTFLLYYFITFLFFFLF